LVQGVEDGRLVQKINSSKLDSFSSAKPINMPSRRDLDSTRNKIQTASAISNGVKVIEGGMQYVHIKKDKPD
jgi:hypothetical protein